MKKRDFHYRPVLKKQRIFYAVYLQPRLPNVNYDHVSLNLCTAGLVVVVGVAAVVVHAACNRFIIIMGF